MRELHHFRESAINENALYDVIHLPTETEDNQQLNEDINKLRGNSHFVSLGI